MRHPTKEAITLEPHIPETLEELLVILQANHFYPGTQTELKKKGIQALYINCPPILKTERTDRVREVVGEGWKLDWVGNGEDKIVITKQK